MAEHDVSTSPPSHVNEKSDNRRSSSSSDPEAATVAEEDGVVQEVDAESPEPGPLAEHPPSNHNIVTWDGPDDPQNPLNWPRRKKWIQITTVSFFTLMSPVASSMLAPALPIISKDLHMTSEVIASMSLSIFVLAYAVGPLFLAPLSEILGRQVILQGANMFFLIFNIACSQAHTPTQMIVFRFLAGLGGSAPLAVGGGTITDLFSPDERGLAVSIYTLAPLAGPALGPIAGGFVAENVSWRWIFYASSIADGVVQLFGLIFLRETYPPKILGDKAKRLRKETGNDKLQTQWERPDRTIFSVIGHGLLRPMRILATEPMVQILAGYMAVLYGIMYLTLTTFASLWSKSYGESVGIGGLNYIALGLGFSFGVQIGSLVLDRSYAALKARNGGVATPEMRLPLMMMTSFVTPIGILIFGWTAHKHVFWLVPDIGIAIYAIGSIGSTLSIQTYIIDNFGLHAASGLAAATAFRSVAGFGFPLFAEAMFNKLGTGWGNSVLALTTIIFLPAPFLFYRYGAALRARSPNAIKQAAKDAREAEK